MTAPRPDNYSYPPRGMDRMEACRYLGIGLTLFDEMVRDGRMPPPRMANSRAIWDRVALDVAFQSLPERQERSKLAKMLDD
jgi:predicted DNA-binding transcriptional regulator AlpA